MPASSCKDACYGCCYCTRKECWVLASLVGHLENVVCHKLPWLARLASCRVLWTGEIASLPQCLLPSALQPVFLCHPLTTFPKSAVCSHYHLLPPNKIKARSNSTTNRYENIEMENDSQVHFSIHDTIVQERKESHYTTIWEYARHRNWALKQGICLWIHEEACW